MIVIEVMAVVMTFVGIMTFMCSEPHHSLQRSIVETIVILIAMFINAVAANKHEIFWIPVMFMAPLLFVEVGVMIFIYIERKVRCSH